MDRRTFLGLLAMLPLDSAASRLIAAEDEDQTWVTLEADLAGRLGVCAIDTETGQTLAHRADERFPLCSTFKVMLAAAVLHRSDADPGLLDRRIPYAAGDLVTYSPITEKHVGEGMTVAELCAAALQYSDNTAANLLLRLLAGDDGPAALTAFARSMGDDAFRLDRFETELNTAIPDDERDTTTPRAMASSLQRLLLGDALAPANRDRLRDWMLGNTTGAARIRAGVPADWKVADKTGTGDYGTANDVGVLYPPNNRPPLILAIYTTHRDPNADPRSEIIAAAARIAAGVIR